MRQARSIRAWASVAWLGAGAWLAAASGAGAAAPCVPRLVWEWDARSLTPSRLSAVSTPIIVHLTDDDGDGRHGPGDVADVVVSTGDARFGLLDQVAAVDGATGRTLFNVTDPAVFGSSLAAGDLDADGIVEIVAVDEDGTRLIVFDHRGRVVRLSDPFPQAGLYTTTAIADVDQDGSPEIVAGDVVLRADGSVAFVGGRGRGVNLYGIGGSHAVDLRPELPGLELIAGNTLYGSDGSVIWQAGALEDGPTAVGDLDGDGLPETALVIWNTVHVLSALGVEIAPPVSIGDPYTIVSEPNIADVDGDGTSELVVPWQRGLDAWRLGPTGMGLVWRVARNDNSCCATASAADIDGDGAFEVLERDEDVWRTRDGATGGILAELPFVSATIVERPVVADIDGDGIGEIIVTGGPHWDSAEFGGIRVFAWDCLPRGRSGCIWNQHAFHVTNIAPDGTIPRFETAPWAAGAGWSAQSNSACAAPPPACDCAGLLARIAALAGHPRGSRRSLEAKAEAACRSLARSQDRAAAGQLSAILHELDAQEGRHVTAAQARSIRDCVEELAESEGLELRRRRR